MTVYGIEADAFAPAVARACPTGEFLPVLFENEELLILHKASGVPTLPHSSEDISTAVSSALVGRPELLTVGARGLEPGLLHRLDTGTSGCLAFAKTEEAFTRIRALWKSASVRKHYRALVQGERTEALIQARAAFPGEIRTPLAASEKSAKRMMAVDSDRTRGFRGAPLPACTRLVRWREIAGRDPSDYERKPAGQAGVDAELKPTGHALLDAEPKPMVHSLLDFELEIETGVRHQIRCHLASIGFPILGDPIYGPAARGVGGRLWLHAWKIELPLSSGSRLSVEAALPLGWPA